MKRLTLTLRDELLGEVVTALAPFNLDLRITSFEANPPPRHAEAVVKAEAALAAAEPEPDQPRLDPATEPFAPQDGATTSDGFQPNYHFGEVVPKDKRSLPEKWYGFHGQLLMPTRSGEPRTVNRVSGKTVESIILDFLLGTKLGHTTRALLAAHLQSLGFKHNSLSPSLSKLSRANKLIVSGDKVAILRTSLNQPAHAGLHPPKDSAPSTTNPNDREGEGEGAFSRTVAHDVAKGAL